LSVVSRQASFLQLANRVSCFTDAIIGEAVLKDKGRKDKGRRRHLFRGKKIGLL